MGTLYIDRKGLHIRLDGSALAFYADGRREGVVPVNPLKRVIVVGTVTIETPVLHRLAEEKISVVFLSGKTLRFRSALRGGLHNNGLLRVRQYAKTLEGFADEVARDIVRRKVDAQRAFLMEARQERPELRLPLTTAANTLTGILGTLSDHDVDAESLRGLEGGASAAYFAAFTRLFAPSLRFRKRSRRPPGDPVNAMLSLCYTLLHYELLREIEVIGLDPTIGFYHRFDYGRESLACDLVEPFRSDVDVFVWNLFRKRAFTRRDFSLDDERPGCYLTKESRKRFYPEFEAWAQEMRPRWTEEVRALARRIMDGQDPVPE